MTHAVTYVVGWPGLSSSTSSLAGVAFASEDVLEPITPSKRNLSSSSSRFARSRASRSSASGDEQIRVAYSIT